MCGVWFSAITSEFPQLCSQWLFVSDVPYQSQSPGEEGEPGEAARPPLVASQLLEDGDLVLAKLDAVNWMDETANDMFQADVGDIGQCTGFGESRVTL